MSLPSESRPPDTAALQHLSRHRPLRRAIFAGAGALLAISVLADGARAAVLPPVTLDGPSEEIVGFGGTAMAEDGTGGIVYLKRVQGVAHVFVARYASGHWQAPIRVDAAESFAASSPRIGAAAGGRLLVVWATPYATVRGKPVSELLSATLSPGSEAFSGAVIVDPNVGEAAGLSPDLAMSSSGQGYVVYRVIGNLSTVSVQRPGDVAESVRVARYDGERWTSLGSVNRDPGVSMRPPSAANAPVVAINQNGNGIVVWQEPEIGTAVARIWARRLFGTNVNYVLPVSATSFHGAAINEDADAPAVAFSRLGQAEVAYRQPAGRGSPLPGPRIFLNILSDGEAASGAEFEGPIVADNSVPGGKNASVGRPTIDVNERQGMRLLYDSNGTPRVVEGTDLGLAGTVALGSPFVGSTLAPAAELPAANAVGPEGGGIAAWPSADRHGRPGVAVREDYPGGGAQTGLISGGAGGPIGELAVGRSGLGDGLVAFQQGPLGDAAIVAAEISAVPSEFIVNAPKGWILPRAARLSWLAAESANGPLTYTVVLDGHRLPTPPEAQALTIDPHYLSTGKHIVQVLATDRNGQSTLSARSALRIDASPPTVSLSLARRAPEVAVRLRDGQSGVAAKSVSISFGDGSHARGSARARHRYKHGGTFTLVIHAQDLLGNSVTLHKVVKVA
ncbi:MAG TPA: hypothetical protein VNV44_07530 [Solirubrobacteraceae bacterium]|nr:hypothetical protein [Solirubrobacteraceae bacterium]